MLAAWHAYLKNIGTLAKGLCDHYTGKHMVKVRCPIFKTYALFGWRVLGCI